MTLIVDASVAAKWFFEEEGSSQAAKLREQELAAPDFILLEVHHAMWKRLIRRETEASAVARVQPILRTAISRLVPSETLAGAASELSLAHSLSIYDCLYLALAKETNERLITADQRQFLAARRMRLKPELL